MSFSPDKKLSPQNRNFKSSQIIESFFSQVAQNSPNINPENPLEGIEDSLCQTPKFFLQFIGILANNTRITQLLYPGNKTIAQRESTIKELATAIQKETSLGAIRSLKIFTSVPDENIILAFQAHASTLESVTIKWCPLTISIAQKWAEFIRNNQVLTSITLNVGREGGVDTDTCGMLLAESLQRNEHVTTVKMRANDFGEKSALQFARVLTTNRSLTHLDLSSNCMNDKALVPLFQALKNSNLKTLVIKDNSLKGEDEGTQQMAEALKENKSLTHLNLFANSLDILGAMLLAGALKFNFTLKYLDLYGNNIRDSGAEEIAKMLKVNRGLIHLSLQSNGISELGIQHIAESLHSNNTLTSLNLAANIIGKGAVSLCKMISVNSALAKLDLRFTDAKKQVIEQTLKCRSRPLEIVWLY